MVKSDISFTNKPLFIVGVLCLAMLGLVVGGCRSDENATHDNISAIQSSSITSLPPYGDKMAMIRIAGKYYSCTEKVMLAPSESQILGAIDHIRPDDSEVWYCTQDNEVSAGFPEFYNQPYADVNGNMIIKHGDEWHLLVESNFTPPE